MINFNASVLDFYYHKDFLKEKFPVFVHNILLLLEQQIHDTINSNTKPLEILSEIFNEKLNGKITDNELEILKKTTTRKLVTQELIKEIDKVNIPTFRALLSSIIRYFIDDKYTFEIAELNTPFDYVAIKLNEVPYNNINSNVSQAIDTESNPDRKHELMQILKQVPKRYNGFIICSLCRINIYDFSKSPNERIITDIDSVVVKINSNELIVELNESKNMKRNAENEAIKDIRSNVLKTLNKNCQGYQVYRVKGYGAKVRIKINAM